MIEFKSGLCNQLLINPRLPDEEKKILAGLKNAFEKEFGDRDYFLVPSSGSSKSAEQSVKLIALHLESVLNSARRANFYLNAKQDNNWGLFLPEFHVAGLGILARAYLARAEVKKFTFSVEDFAANISMHQVSFLSLVPAQIFDLVSAGIRAPASVKKVFVGGGFLNPLLKTQIAQLDWPVTETYGMTETGSMVAVREGTKPYFELMPGVSAKVEEDLLSLRCDSLLSATVQKSGDEVSVVKFDRGGWLKTDDVAVIHETESTTYLELLGRKSDYIKILGEGVSLSELRSKLQIAGTGLGIDSRSYEIVAGEHPRSGYQLVLVVEDRIPEILRQDLVNLFNKSSRPFERISKVLVLRQIPRSELGKLKTAELKSIIKDAE